MTQLDLDELERVARAATPGEWKQLGAKVVVEPYRTIQCFGVIRRGPDGTNASLSEDAAYIASFNPSVALELIRLARLGKWAEQVGVASDHELPEEIAEQCRLNAMGQEREAKLMAEVERLRKELIEMEHELCAEQAEALNQHIRAEDLREALEFYARIGVPQGATPTGDTELARDPYWQDQGKIARKALGWGKR